MGKLGRHRLKSFSLPETVVAMVIILSVFAIATMVLTGTGRTQLTVQQLNAANLLRVYAAKTAQGRDWSTDSVQIDGFRIRKEVSLYPGYDSLLLIHYSIRDVNNKNLADWQSLVRTDE